MLWSWRSASRCRATGHGCHVGRGVDLPFDLGEVEEVLAADERLHVRLPIDFFHASAHNLHLSSPHVALTNQRYLVFSRRGVMKKSLELAASWQLLELTSRINSSEGPIQGTFSCLLSLFDQDGETISAGFKTRAQRDDFAAMVHEVFQYSPEPGAADAVDGLDKVGRRESVAGFVRSIESLASADMIGEPFGEGCGLETAVSCVHRFFLETQQVRDCGRMAAVELLSATEAGLAPDHVLDVMGATPERLAASGLDGRRIDAVQSLSGALYTFLGQFEDPDSSIWNLWRTRDDVAAEFLSWLLVARLRLATTGQLKGLSW